MKKCIAAVLAVLCLAGCSAREEKADTIGVTVVSDTEEPAEIPEEPAVEEVPMEENAPEEAVEEEPAPELTEDAPEGAIDTYAVAEELVEGLVDDAIGYAICQPEFVGFPAAETVNTFYEKLVAQLETYTKETVHAECLERHCMANVFGTVLSHQLTGNNLELSVEYELKVEYSDGSDPQISVRTDVFNVQTGEQKAE